MRIDSHQHFWKFSEEDYPWIGPEMQVLKRDFGPDNLKLHLDEYHIEGVVAVQARTEEIENDFLFGHAAQNDFIEGVVGWFDLTKEDVGEKVARFAAHPKAVGLREVLQGIEDREYCLREDFNRGISTLHDFGLTYDILILGEQIPSVISFVDRHPTQAFVLDHISKPVIGPAGVDVAWEKSIRSLAEREQVCCKLSGMITEIAPDWDNCTPELLRPWFEVVLEAFGTDRLLFGSDWPVCLRRGEYADWVQCVDVWIEAFSADEKSAILGGNAARFYGLA